MLPYRIIYAYLPTRILRVQITRLSIFDRTMALEVAHMRIQVQARNVLAGDPPHRRDRDRDLDALRARDLALLLPRAQPGRDGQDRAVNDRVLQVGVRADPPRLRMGRIAFDLLLGGQRRRVADRAAVAPADAQPGTQQEDKAEEKKSEGPRWNDEAFQERWISTEQCLTDEPEQRRERLLAMMGARTERVKPPFPALPAFALGAMILGYLGYADEVIPLLNLLNVNA